MAATGIALILAVALSTTFVEGFLSIAPARRRRCKEGKAPPLADDTTMKPKHTDVVFTKISGKNLKLDIYVPENHQQASGIPALIYIHGGMWQSFDKTPIREWTRKVRDDLGYAVVSIQFRATSEAGQWGDSKVTWPAQGDDILSAVRWVKTKGSSYGIDTKRVGCWGESSGGHLCFWLATAGATSSATRMNVAVGMFAESCFLCTGYIDEQWTENIHDKLFGFDGGRVSRLKADEMNPNTKEAEDIKLVNSAEPLYQLVHKSKNTTSPTFIGHGLADTCAPPDTAKFFSSELGRFGVTNQYLKVPQGGHSYTGWSDSHINEAISFLKLHM